MPGIHDRVSRMAQAGVSRQIEAGATVGEVLVNGIREYADLNLNMARATLEQGNLVARQLMSARDPHHVLSLAAAQMRPNASRHFDYGYYLATIIANNQARLIRALGHRIAETNRDWIAFAGDAVDSGRHGWKALLTVVKEFLDGAAHQQVAIASVIHAVCRQSVHAPARKPRLAYPRPVTYR